MKKIIFLSLIVLSLSASSALAVDSSYSPDMTTKRRPDSPTQPKIQEVRQDIVADQKDLRGDIFKLHAARITGHFTFYYNRLNNIMTRFQTRLDTLKTSDKDTSSTQAKLDLAKAKLAEAKAKGDAAIAAFNALDPSKLGQEKTQRLAARDLAVAARQLFVDTHTLLQAALKELKTISKPALPASSSAVQNAQ